MRTYSVRNLLLFTSIGLIIFLSGCSVIFSDSGKPGNKDINIGPEFSNFYSYLGGEEVIGRVISRDFELDGVFFQYTERALLVYDPSASVEEKFYLGNIGSEMDLLNYRESSSIDIYEFSNEINDILASLQDSYPLHRFRGNLLSDILFNRDPGRIEVYFQNLGIYFYKTKEGFDARIMDYGSWKCGDICFVEINSTGSVTVPHAKDILNELPTPKDSFPPGSQILAYDQLKTPIVKELLDGDQVLTLNGESIDYELTGFAITPPYRLDDDTVEQVFENVVVRRIVDTEKIILRRLPEALGLKHDLIEKSGEKEGLVFLEVEEGEGYNIRQATYNYLNRVGGIATSGFPITRIIRGIGKWKQCFYAFCLEEFENEDGSKSVKPIPNGYDYIDKYLKDQDILGKSTPDFYNLTITTEVLYPNTTDVNSQQILVTVMQAGVPVSGIQPWFGLYRRNGGDIETFGLATDRMGKSRFPLSRLTAANGTIIPFQVCVYGMVGEPVCVKDELVIWK